MTEQQRKAIEILNNIKNEQKLDGEQIINDDDYFFLLSFIIDKPQEITVAPCPVIPPFQPLTPYYNQQWEVTGKVDDNVRQLKQTEQNPTDNSNKVEPKYHEGEWVVSPNGVYWHIDAIRDGHYQVSSNSGAINDWSLEANIYHRFTIQDAKDGDVLTWDDNKCIALFKNIYDEESFNSHGFVGHCTNIFESRISYHDIEGAHPATKEQRDLLFEKMEEAGYMWDSKNKELQEIEQNPTDNSNKVEPKFKVGDWVTDGHLHCKISEVLDDRYIVDTKFAKRSSITFEREHDYHLWTIADAKDGDVLATESPYYPSPFVAIYKEHDLNSFNSHCFVSKNGIFNKSDTGHATFLIHPASKKQRDLLFQKMKDAGYEWDAEKKN